MAVIYSIYAYYTIKIYCNALNKKDRALCAVAFFLQFTSIFCSVQSLFNDIFVGLTIAICINKLQE